MLESTNAIQILQISLLAALTEIKEENIICNSNRKPVLLIFVSNFALGMKKHLTSENFCAGTLSRF